MLTPTASTIQQPAESFLIALVNMGFGIWTRSHRTLRSSGPAPLM